MAQYNDGDSRTIDGVTYVRTNGAWLPKPAGSFATPTLPYEGPQAAANLKKTQAEVAMTPDQALEAHAKAIAAERENMMFVGDPNKHGADYINSIPSNYANYRNIIPLIAENKVQVGNVARSNNEAKLLISGAKQYDPHYDPSLASVRAQALQAYTGNGDASLRIQALDRAASVLSQMKKYSDQMGGPNTGYSPLSGLIAGKQQDVGTQRILAAKGYDTLLPEAMGQIDTLLAGGKTVSGSNEIKQGLDPHASQAERNAAFQALSKAIENAAVNLKAGWNSAYGGTAAPPMWIRPENAAFIESMSGAPKGSLGADEWHGLPGLSPDGTYTHNGPQFPAATAPAPTNSQIPGASDFVLNGGKKTEAKIDPVLQAAGAHIGRMLASGAPAPDILKFMQDSGIDPANTSINQALQFRQSPDFTRWQNANPGQPYPIGPSFYTKQVPVTPARRLFNQAAASDLGGDAAAATVATGNSMLGDRGASFIGALGGDPAMAKVGMNLLRNNHPISSLGGDIAGQALDEAALGQIPGAQALMATRWGRRGADALYGAYSGSGDDSNGNAVGGAIAGAGLNTLGGMFGRGLQSGVGKTATGVKNTALQYLDNAGVPLTIGQIGRGSGNVIGRSVGGVEDRLSGLPGFDAVIDAARKRGEVGFNQAAFKEAGVPDGLTGGAGLNVLNGIKNNAYNFLDNTTLPLDAQFAGSQAGIRASIPDMPAFGKEVGLGLNQIDKVSQGGSLAGTDWQSALRDARGNRSSILGQPFAGKAADALGEVDNNLLGLADRQGPPGTVDNLNAANRVNAQFQTLSKALDTGAAQKSGQMFSPLQLDNASRVNTRAYGGRLASLTGQNRPFYDLTQAGMQVMPNLTPDSGTAGRMWLIPLISSAVGGGIGALDGGEGEKGKDSSLGAGFGLALGASALGPYSNAGQKVIQKALLADRPEAATKIGDYLITNRKYGGMFGSGLGRDLQYYLAQ